MDRADAARRTVLHSNFTRSRLVRSLAEWAPLDAEVSGMDFAERMSLWFNAFDAIRLQAVHQSIRSVPAAPGAAAPARRTAGTRQAQALAENFQRVRAALAHAIAQEILALPAVRDEGPAYAPYRQRHAELQRQMELMIAPLRDHVRQALTRASPRLRQLAVLDAALEQMLTPREQAILPTAATLMERRYRQLQLAQREATETAAQQEQSTPAPIAPAWLETFEKDWRQALLAELDLRLEPVAGLIDALTHESNLQE